MFSTEINTIYHGVLCGLGRIGSLLEDDSLREKPATHAGAMNAHPRVLLWGGADTDSERCRVFEERWPGTQTFESLKKLLKSKVPDFGVISTWPDSHLNLIRLMVDSGVKLIVCEKPLAPSAREAQKAVKYCKNKGVTLIVNHERRFSLDYQWVREQIVSGSMGRLLSIRATVYMGQKRTPGEVLLWDGTHMLDILRYLTGGELKALQARGDKNKSGGALQMTLNAGGIPVSMEVGCSRDYLQFELDLSFETGRIQVGNGVLQAWKSQSSPFYEKMRSLLPSEAPRFLLTGYFSRMMDEVVRVLDGVGDSRPLSTGYDGWMSLKAIDQALKRAKRF